MRILIIIAAMLLFSGCSESLERIKRIGKTPDFSNLDIPTAEEDEEETERRQQQKAELHSHMRKTNSLWQPGAKRFFTDSRAWQVGDIITVKVEIQDSASLNNSTQQKRDGSDDLAVPKLFGKENALSKIIAGSGENSSLISTASKRAHSGSGNISRKESIQTEIAAIVTKILPNGNLFVQGKQEVRVNYELRDVRVAGIIRQKDISSTNSIKTNQMAEARISYGGRGVVSDVQQPRIGSQVVDIISPF